MRLLPAEDEASLSRAIAAILRKHHYEVDQVMMRRRRWTI